VQFIELTQGYYAIVDDEDYAELSKHKWHASVQKSGIVYAARKVGRKNIKMHRVLFDDIPEDKLVDHINHNQLDNRRENLRLVTKKGSQRSKRGNRFSSSRFKGVSWNRCHGGWEARICVGGQNLNLGLFSEETNAAHAYDEAAIEHFGDNAYLNFPKETV